MLVLDASFLEELPVLDLNVSKSETTVCGNSHEAIAFEEAYTSTICYFERTSSSVWFLSWEFRLSAFALCVIHFIEHTAVVVSFQ